MYILFYNKLYKYVQNVCIVILYSYSKKNNRIAKKKSANLLIVRYIMLGTYCVQYSSNGEKKN